MFWVRLLLTFALTGYVSLGVYFSWWWPAPAEGASGIAYWPRIMPEVSSAALVTLYRLGLGVLAAILAAILTAIPAAFFFFRGRRLTSEAWGLPWTIILLLPQFFWLFLLGINKDFTWDKYFFWFWSGAIAFSLAPFFFSQQFSAASNFFRTRSFDALVVAGYSRWRAMAYHFKKNVLRLSLVQVIYGLSMAILVGAAFGHSGVVQVGCSPDAKRDIICGIASSYNKAQNFDPGFESKLVSFVRSTVVGESNLASPSPKTNRGDFFNSCDFLPRPRQLNSKSYFLHYLVFMMLAVAWLQSMYTWLEEKI